MNSTIVPPTAENLQAYAAYIDAHQPVAPGSGRHQKYLEQLVKDGLSPSFIDKMRHSRDAVDLGQRYGNAFAVLPSFPEVPAPTWATSHEDWMLNAAQGEPLQRDWEGTLIQEGPVTVRVQRTDWYDFTTGKVEQGEETVDFQYGHHQALGFIDVEHLREAAQYLLQAADLWATHGAVEGGNLS